MLDFWPLIETFIVFMILIPFILFNLLIGIGSFFQKKVSSFLINKLDLEEKYKNSRIKLFNIINFIVWMIVGLVYTISLENLFSISSVVIFLAFRNGITLSKRTVLGIHDLKIMESHLSDKKYIKIASRIVKISIIIELTFLVVWGVLYRTLSIGVKSNFGIEVNLLVLILWIAGLIYGLVISLILSIPSKILLLKNEIGIAFLLSGEVFKEKLRKKTLIPNFFKKK